MLVLLLLYGLGYSFLPTFKPQTSLVLHFVHAIFWCSLHYFGLGLLLRAQSQNKFLVRHYLKNYHYDDGGQGAIIEAFTNWKSIYNLSMCMTYGKSSALPFCPSSLVLVSCIGLVWKAYLLPTDWTVGDELLRHTIGIVRFLPFQSSMSANHPQALNRSSYLGDHGVMGGPWNLWSD